jgi:hypothetical protein
MRPFSLAPPGLRQGSGSAGSAARPKREIRKSVFYFLDGIKVLSKKVLTARAEPTIQKKWRAEPAPFNFNFKFRGSGSRYAPPLARAGGAWAEPEPPRAPPLLIRG